MVPEAFESACRQRKATVLYCVPTLHNPTVTTLPSKRRRAIARIASDYGVAIVEDDVMRPLVDDAPPPLATLEPTRSFFISTLSKAISGGLRVAFVACPRNMVSNLGESIWATQYMVPPLMAEIAATWIEDATAEKTIRRKRIAMAQREAIARELLSGFTLHSDPSSYHGWLELPGDWNSAQFTAEARRRGVLVTPAEAFQAGGGEAPRAVRVCLGAVDDEHTLRAGLEVLADIAARSPNPGRAIV
jgi:DNA-binding transcriptional MocR family regulator